MSKELSKNAKPILFNTEMVQAILDGRKTQTRRVIPFNEYVDYTDTMNEHIVEVAWNYCTFDDYPRGEIVDTFIKYHGKYKVGNILYVRETFQLGINVREKQNIPLSEDIEVLYYENEINNANSIHRDFAKEIKWKPSIHMPKKLARIFLKVTNVRVERLQDISWDDAKAEGVKAILDYNDVHPEIGMPSSDYVTSFKKVWEETSNPNYKWQENPYVFVYEFERVI